MILYSNDSFGCGRSVVWEIKAVQIATKNGEACPCINYYSIIVKMKPNQLEGHSRIKCIVKCPDCNADYSKTSEKLTLKLLKFYGK